MYPTAQVLHIAAAAKLRDPSRLLPANVFKLNDPDE